jgi:hypothetical protein
MLSSVYCLVVVRLTVSLVLTLVLAALSNHTEAATSPANTSLLPLHYASNVGPQNCELSLALIDDALLKAREMRGTSLIIISRLGQGEKNAKLHDTRLGFVEVRLKSLGYDDYVTAIGKNAKTSGRVEFYVGGSLFQVIELTKNSKQFCADSMGL